MFASGNWAVFGLDAAQENEFVNRLNDERTMISVSQLTASATTRVNKRDAVGINPVIRPRLDESFELDFADAEKLAQFADLPAEQRQQSPRPMVINQLETDAVGYYYGDDAFRVGAKVYAFWFVTNEWKDVSHLNSIKEQLSYLNYERPYKFLSPNDKKTLDEVATAGTATQRKQFPVLLDFQNGRVYVENTNKNVLVTVLNLLDTLGVQATAVAWQFGENWLKPLLSKLYAESQFKDDFKRAADDAGRFFEDEREEIEDKEKAGIVSNFFSMTELENGLWAGLSTPSGINLHKAMSPVITQDVNTATALLYLTDDAAVNSASVTLQERTTSTNKKTGEERSFRRSLVTFELSDQINQVESGAALLRGFDIPYFKKDILREIKRSKQTPSIDSFWRRWVGAMDEAVRTIESSLREALEIKDRPTGILPFFGEGDEVVEIRSSAVVEEGNIGENIQAAETGLQELRRMVYNGDLTVEVAGPSEAGE
jgi:hypothetical protein